MIAQLYRTCTSRTQYCNSLQKHKYMPTIKFVRSMNSVHRHADTHSTALTHRKYIDATAATCLDDRRKTLFMKIWNFGNSYTKKKTHTQIVERTHTPAGEQSPKNDITAIISYNSHLKKERNENQIIFERLNDCPNILFLRVCASGWISLYATVIASGSDDGVCFG